MKEIFEYADYRCFLRDYFLFKKQENKNYSHRFFSLRANIKSSGFLSDVMKGKRSLTTNCILQFSRALRLAGEERRYFEDLVRFNQSRKLEERNHWYGRLLSYKKTNPQVIGKEQNEFYGKWYHSAIRELLYFYHYSDDDRALSKKLNPSITAGQAQSAIRVLEKIGLINRDKNGRYRQSNTFITTGKGPSFPSLANFQRTMMDLGKDALDRFQKEDRDISTLTLTLSQNSMEKAKMEIAALRKSLLLLAEEDQNVDRVVQFNFQMFPLTKS